MEETFWRSVLRTSRGAILATALVAAAGAASWLAEDESQPMAPTWDGSIGDGSIAVMPPVAAEERLRLALSNDGNAQRFAVDPVTLEIDPHVGEDTVADEEYQFDGLRDQHDALAKSFLIDSPPQVEGMHRFLSNLFQSAEVDESRLEYEDGEVEGVITFADTGLKAEFTINDYGNIQVQLREVLDGEPYNWSMTKIMIDAMPDDFGELRMSGRRRLWVQYNGAENTIRDFARLHAGDPERDATHMDPQGQLMQGWFVDDISGDGYAQVTPKVFGAGDTVIPSYSDFYVGDGRVYELVYDLLKDYVPEIGVLTQD